MSMILHVLNGDAMLPRFKRSYIEGDVLIWRESLIEGPLVASNDELFWKQRCEYICTTYDVPPDEYIQQVVNKLYKLKNAARYSQINLWFEFDLFCQTNLFYILQRIDTEQLKSTRVYWVQPEQESHERFISFTRSSSRQLNIFYENRILLNDADLDFASNVWTAYASDELSNPEQLLEQAPEKFQFFDEVLNAHLQRLNINNQLNRVEKRLLEVAKNGVNSELDLFYKFGETESIYGFGSSQIINYVHGLQHKKLLSGLEITAEGLEQLNVEKD